MSRDDEIKGMLLFAVGLLLRGLLIGALNFFLVAGALMSTWGWFFVPAGAPDVMTYPMALGVLLTTWLLQSGFSMSIFDSARSIEDFEISALRYFSSRCARFGITLLLWSVAYLVHLFV